MIDTVAQIKDSNKLFPCSCYMTLYYIPYKYMYRVAKNKQLASCR